MSLGDALERIVLDSIFGNGSPASYQLGLSSSAPTDAGTLNELTVLNGYSRLTVTNNTTNFPAAFTGTDGKTHKRLATNFTWSATGAWSATATYWFLWDSTNSRLVVWGQMVTPMPVLSSGDIVRLNGGSLDITLD